MLSPVYGMCSLLLVPLLHVQIASEAAARGEPSLLCRVGVAAGQAVRRCGSGWAARLLCLRNAAAATSSSHQGRMR